MNNKKKWVCDNCDDVVNKCDVCNRKFKLDEEIICSSGTHFHEDCYEADYEEARVVEDE